MSVTEYRALTYLRRSKYDPSLVVRADNLDMAMWWGCIASLEHDGQLGVVTKKGIH